MLTIKFNAVITNSKPPQSIPTANKLMGYAKLIKHYSVGLLW